MTAASAAATEVTVDRLPSGSLQPHVSIDALNGIHIICLRGTPAAADVWYAYRPYEAEGFSPWEQVNSLAGTAIATGTVRGPRLAAGRNGHVHVLWNAADGKSTWYAVRSGAGAHFSPQRNLMTVTSGVDGGGAIAADAQGHVLAAWHTHIPGAPNDEGGRGVFVARSQDDGETFSPEARVWSQDTGACGCCGLALGMDPQGRATLIYRSAAAQGTQRDLFLLTERESAGPFQGVDLHAWALNACPMTTTSVLSLPAEQVIAWETAGQIFVAHVDTKSHRASQPVAVPGTGRNRKHPAIAANTTGETLCVWTEGTGWGTGGTVAWQVYSARGAAIGPVGHAEGLPAWDYAAAWAGGDGVFHIIY